MAFDSIKSGVDYLANQFISPIARDNKLLLTAAVLTYIAYEKLVPLSQETQQFTKLGTPNQKYFPQYIENKQGMWLYTTEWKAVNVNQPKGIIFICHGLAEHIHRYEPIGRYFQSHGFTVLGVDHQGHGQSQGIRTYVEKWQDYVDDYIQFIRENQRKAEYQNIPAFLLGHSMGGNIATQVMRQTFNNSGTGVKLQGLILSAPAVWLDPAMAPPLKVKIGGFISKYLPRMVVAKLPLDTLSSIQQVKDQYNDDILVTHGGMQARQVNSSHLISILVSIFAYTVRLSYCIHKH
jgi:alpha-beta hydrolase superfamily lysophospholipase